jgi:hypothetical protein
MKQLSTLMILLMSFGSPAADDNTLSPEAMQAAEKEYLAWHLKLHEHLLASDNDNHKALGILAMINGTLPAWREDPEAEPASSQFKAQIILLNELIDANEMSPQTLQIILGWCFREAIKPYCDQQMILSNLLHIDPQNLLSYLRPLELAHQDLNDDLLQNTLRLMGAAQFSHQRYYLTTDFIQTVDAYLAANPVPDSAIKAFMTDQSLMSGLDPTLADNAEQLIRGYLHHAVKMSYLYLYSHDDLALVFKLCKLNRAFSQSCLNISQLLINQSDTIAARGIGYALLMAVNQVNGRAELVDMVADKQQQYKTAVSCLQQASRSDSFVNDLLDPEYQRIKLLPLPQWDQQLMLAEHMYSKLKAADPDRINPQQCIKDFVTNDSSD